MATTKKAGTKQKDAAIPPEYVQRDGNRLVIDLEAARREREAKHPPHLITFGGEEFTVRAFMPITAVQAARAGQLVDFVRHLFGEQADAFLAHNPSEADLVDLATQLMGDDGSSDSE